jgi:hypothetical protein
MAFWKTLIQPANRGYLRLLVEVQALALTNPTSYGRYLETTSTSWLEVVESALGPSKRRRARATLGVAVIDGLVLELLATGDVRRTTEALALFTERARGPA